MSKPKILLYDFESSPTKGYTWGKYEQNVLAVEEHRQILSVAWQWLGEKKVYVETRQGRSSDYKLSLLVRKLVKQADITVAHNGDKFDLKLLRTRLLYWKSKPLPKLITFDTLKFARKTFSFHGNSLSDITEFLGLAKKQQTRGIDMWLDCMDDKRKAWQEMTAYNRQDVVVLEQVFKRFRPWITEPKYLLKLLGDK